MTHIGRFYRVASLTTPEPARLVLVSFSGKRGVESPELPRCLTGQSRRVPDGSLEQPDSGQLQPGYQFYPCTERARPPQCS